jgi:hypothetical protein
MGRRARRWVLLVAGVAVALLAAACVPTPPTPNADYQFYAWRDGFRPLSCAATPALALVPIGSADADDAEWLRVVESVDGVNEHVGTFSHGAGYMLSDTTGEVPTDAYSIVMLFRLSEIGGYDRLIDFKNGTADSGLYLQAGFLRFHPLSGLGSKVIANNEYAQVVVTRAADGVVQGFVDGVQQWQFTDTTGDGLISPNTLRFFLDNSSGGVTTEHSAGAVARIRLFNRPLSRTEINNLGQTPGNPCTG